MSALSIQIPYPAFAGTDGLPLENGYIWIGTVNLNPITNPIAAYWDSALTISAVQPIRTSGGYPVYQGTPARLYVNSNYSIQVQNSKGSMVYSAPTATERYSEVILAGVVTLSELADETDVAKGDALVGYHQSNQSGLIPNTYGRTVHDKLQEFVSVFDFMTDAEIQAVKTNSFLDVTASVQNALDYAESGRGKYLKFPAGDYRVTQITIGRTGNRNGSTYDFYNNTIFGIGSGSSIVQIKSGANRILGLTVGGQQSESYECGVHWFTNDVAVYYPGYMTITDMFITGCMIGFCIGALPSQAVIPPYLPPAVLPDGNAVNAPLSESFVTNLQISDCIRAVYMRQPNGKLSFIQPMLNPRNQAWAPTPATASGNIYAITIRDGELNVIGGEVLNISSPDGGLIDVGTFATLNLIGVAMESQSPIYMTSGRATLRISGNANWGLNNDSTNFFRIFPDQDGELVVTDSFLRRGFGTSSGQAVVRGVSDVSGSYAVNNKMFVNFTNVEFGDSNFQGSSSSYLPLIKGVRSVVKNCRLVQTSLSSGYPRVYDYKVDEKTNLLAGIVDLSSTVITAYGVNGNATSGGFTFTDSVGTASWGRYTVGLPTIQSYSVAAALRLTATGGGTVLQATSAKFAVEPQRPYLLKGWIKTGTSAAILKLVLNYYDFSNTASSIDAQFSVFEGPEAQFGSTWQPLIAWFVPPADTTKAELVLYAENNVDFQIFNLQIM